MRTVRLPLLRGALFIIALAAMSILLARADNPAQATTYNPQSTVSISDSSPGAHADLIVNFSLNAPESFPNITTDSSIQFLPRSWGINAPETYEEKVARIGGVAGTFNLITNVGILGTVPCAAPVPVNITMYEATTDTSRLTSALDVDPTIHPGGLGYSGQFAGDPAWAAQPPSDFGLPLVNFVTLGDNKVGNEFHNSSDAEYNPRDWNAMAIYRDNDGSGAYGVPYSGVTPGDTRLTPLWKTDDYSYPAGSIVQAGDTDAGVSNSWSDFIPMAPNEKHVDPNGNGLMDPGEGVYVDVDGDGKVSYNDIRWFKFEGERPGGVVKGKSFLYGGVGSYPDFLAQMFPPDVVGEPLARMWGGGMVVEAAVSVNLVTFRPGQLGYPASLGYATVTVVLDPLAQPDMAQLNMTNVTCAPLSLTSTNYAISRDNPMTPLKDEGGYVRLTNPRSEKDHIFTLVTTSDYDSEDADGDGYAEGDGIENWLDTCDLTPNTPAGDDGRQLYGGPGDVDSDGLNESCDPDPSGQFWGSMWILDQDRDSYTNAVDNCPVNGNGWEWYDPSYKVMDPFWFWYAAPHGAVGPNDQADTDYDRIGDACEGSEAGTQCANSVSDDADGVVNDGCPVNVARAESGAQCANAVDDDHDGKVNDGCPKVVGVAESGDRCANAVDDDGDGWINEGCPAATGSPESGDQCANTVDDDGDGLVNDGCPVQSNAETGGQCANAVDDDGDGKVNDGCPSAGARAESPTAQTIRQFLHPDSVIASSQWSNWYAKENAFDGNLNTGWCTSGSDKAPGNYIEAQFASAQDINSLDLTNPWAGERFNTGRITMSNGFSQDITLTSGGGTFTFPTQTGVTWVRFTGLTQNGYDACFGEFDLNLSLTTLPAECGNATDDDGDGVVNDGCPRFPSTNAESGAQCGNATDDDYDGKVNDGCPPNGQGAEQSWLGQCSNAVDDDGDGLINDGCPYGQWGDGNCYDALDSDGDGVVNDGCWEVVALGAPEAQCVNNANDDSWDDSFVNDGCPAVGDPETGDQCGNLADDDGDGVVNDGCPSAGSTAEIDGCGNATDDDGDGLVNDGCPAVDPGDVAKTTPTGHKHVVSVVNAVPIFKHGIKLSTLGGPPKVKDSGARTYTVDVSNLSASENENVQVALRVVGGCGTVNGADGQNTDVVSLAPGGSGSADFTVDFTGCTAGEYTIQADACHGGDRAPAGFFGLGACPGFAGHGTPAAGVVPLASAIASSESDSTMTAAGNAIDGNDNTYWCSQNANWDPSPTLTIDTAYLPNIDSLTILNTSLDKFEAGTITMSNGFSQDITLDGTGSGSFTFPTQAGVGWVRIGNLVRKAGSNIGCVSELSMNGSWYVAPPDPNPLDDVYMTIDVEVGTTP